MDEITRYGDLASAATTGHWPPHLLAPFDDKVQVLGEALKETVSQIWHFEGEMDEKATLEEENAFLKSDLESLREKAEAPSERQVLAREVAGDNYGLSLEDSVARSTIRGRLRPEERRTFDAGWEAAKQYYLNQPKVADVQS